MPQITFYLIISWRGFAVNNIVIDFLRYLCYYEDKLSKGVIFMLIRTIEINEKGSCKAHATTYFLESNNEKKVVKRPVMVICPGGSYAFVSKREGEPIALAFASRGYHAVVLDYSVFPEAGYPTSLLELGRLVTILRENSDEWHIDVDKIFVMGFSAGGHLAASYGCFWSDGMIADSLGCDKELLRPNGLFLCYPVITSGEKAHNDSFKNLLGLRYDELKDKMSLENQVNSDTPPTFLWHTVTDDLVPYENSVLFADALRDRGIDTELHLFSKGVHGLSLANAVTAIDEWQIEPCCQGWVDLAKKWIDNTFGELRPED